MEIVHNLAEQNWWPLLPHLILLITLAVFLFAWLREPRRLISGVYFTIFLGCFALWITFLIFDSKQRILTAIYGFIVLMIIMAFVLLILFAWVLLLWNAYYVWQRESHTLPNMLTLILGLALVCFSLYVIFSPARYFPQWLNWLVMPIPALLVYVSIVAYNFLINLLLYQFVPRHYHQDYLIVLGAGLINGDQVSKLLAARIDRAIVFAQKQLGKGGQMPKLIMSGGQGSDESISEAAAMKRYAVAHGISQEMILLEDKSVNTLQNMQFSKQIAQQDFGSSNFKATFFSNSFHIFRAGLFAKQAGLNANGVGAKTRFYYLTNAVLREMAGVFVINKKRHLIIMGLITIFILGEAALSSLGIHLF
jgi:uncharacterized SAM-binding protein YcdF (DUF218 family)